MSLGYAYFSFTESLALTSHRYHGSQYACGIDIVLCFWLTVMLISLLNEQYVNEDNQACAKFIVFVYEMIVLTEWLIIEPDKHYDGTLNVIYA